LYIWGAVNKVKHIKIVEEGDWLIRLFWGEKERVSIYLLRDKGQHIILLAEPAQPANL